MANTRAPSGSQDITEYAGDGKQVGRRRCLSETSALRPSGPDLPVRYSTRARFGHVQQALAFKVPSGTFGGSGLLNIGNSVNISLQ